MNAETGKNVCIKGKRQIKGDRSNTLQERLTALTLTTALLSYVGQYWYFFQPTFQHVQTR